MPDPLRVVPPPVAPGPLPRVGWRRGHRLGLPAWEVRLIVAMYHDGITVREIADAARVSTSTVYRYLALVRAAQSGVRTLLGEDT